MYFKNSAQEEDEKFSLDELECVKCKPFYRNNI